MNTHLSGILFNGFIGIIGCVASIMMPPVSEDKIRRFLAWFCGTVGVINIVCAIITALDWIFGWGWIK